MTLQKMKKNNQLKPCPFCGGVNLYITKIVYEFGMFEHKAVVCSDCNAQGPVRMNGNDDYIEFWNKRSRRKDK